jgi:hypothetical protein
MREFPRSGWRGRAGKLLIGKLGEIGSGRVERMEEEF